MTRRKWWFKVGYLFDQNGSHLLLASSFHSFPVFSIPFHSLLFAPFLLYSILWSVYLFARLLARVWVYKSLFAVHSSLRNPSLRFILNNNSSSSSYSSPICVPPNFLLLLRLLSKRASELKPNKRQFKSLLKLLFTNRVNNIVLPISTHPPPPRSSSIDNPNISPT